MTKTIAATLAAATSLLVAMTSSFAGKKTAFPVTVNYAFQFASGTIGDARASADTNQMIGCGVTSSPTNGTGMNCWATDSAGNTATCYSYNAELVKAAQAIGNDSYIFFYFDASGFCTYLNVSGSSHYRPKAN